MIKDGKYYILVFGVDEPVEISAAEHARILAVRGHAPGCKAGTPIYEHYKGGRMRDTGQRESCSCNPIKSF